MERVMSELAHPPASSGPSSGSGAESTLGSATPATARDLMIYGLLSEEWPPAGATDRLANAAVSASMGAAMP
jgi:hypothetical protein